MRPISLVTVFLVCLVVSGPTFAQCVTCQGDIPKSCTGWFYSYPNCNPKVKCDICGSPLPQPYANQLQPGLLLKQEEGRLTAVAVFPGSPAAESGIRKDDEIVSINGKKIGLALSCDEGWEFKNSGSSHLILKRGNSVWEMNVRLWPFSEFVKRRWRGTEVLRSAAVSYGAVTPELSLGRPFTFGIQVREHDTDLLVGNVLIGSPADRAGIRIGDEIISVNGKAFRQSDNQGQQLLEDSDYVRVVELGLVHDGAYVPIRLRSAGLSQILFNNTSASGAASQASTSVAELR